MTPKTSRSWLYFTAVSENKHKCKFCNNIVSSVGPSNLTRHLKKKHLMHVPDLNDEVPVVVPDLEVDLPDYEPMVVEESDSSDNVIAEDRVPDRVVAPPLQAPAIAPAPALAPPPAPAPTQQAKKRQRITAYLHKPLPVSEINRTHRLLLKLMTKFYIPFHILESAEFKNFTESLNRNFKVIDRKTFSNGFLTTVYNEVKDKVVRELESSDTVAITTDGWTSAANESYMSLTVHFINRDCELKSFALECRKFPQSSTAVNVCNGVKEMCIDWGIWDKVKYVTTDNAAYMLSAVGLMRKQHIPCMAHTLNLIVQSSLKHIESTRSKIKSVVEFFRRSHLAAAKLKECQLQQKEPTLKLTNDMPIRWNSTLAMFQRVIGCTSAINACIAVNYPNMGVISERDILVATKAVEILNIFGIISTQMSSQTQTTLSDVIVTVDEILADMRELQCDTDPLCIRDMCDTIMQDVERRFGSWGAKSHYGMATLLDPRFKMDGFESTTRAETMRDLLKIECAAVILQAAPPKPAATSSGAVVLKKPGYGNFQARTKNKVVVSPSSAASVEITRYFEEGLLPLENDPLKWWKENQFSYPRLFKIMKSLLSVPATSVPSERIFSKTGQIISDRRNKLTGDKVTKITFLNYNAQYF